jgi:hypothetical protein
LLTRLSNPKDTNFRVGLVNTAAEFGALISPKQAPPVAEYFRGYSSARGSTWQLSWTARELLESLADDLKFELIRKSMDSQSCPELEASVARFYAELEYALQSEISLTDLPPEIHPERMTLDGTSYAIQIWMGERTLAIYPDRDIDMSLDDASRVLMGIISGCSNALPGTIEEHYGW